MTFDEWCEREPVGEFEGIHAGHVRNAFEAGQANPPDGFKLVPIEPTEEMLQAGFESHEGSTEGVYKAMLDAAPPPCKDKP